MPGRTHQLRLPIRHASVPAARRSVRELLDTWHLPHLTDDAVVIVSELVTNAVQHACKGIGEYVELTVRWRDGALCIEVADSWEWDMPSPCNPTPDELGGRGLLLVDALAEEWGIRPRQVGKTVWARLPTAAGAAVVPC
jgi:anti-sigma regulatory factor (Ser/Thr protein kinase)